MSDWNEAVEACAARLEADAQNASEIEGFAPECLEACRMLLRSEAQAIRHLTRADEGSTDWPKTYGDAEDMAKRIAFRFETGPVAATYLETDSQAMSLARQAVEEIFSRPSTSPLPSRRVFRKRPPIELTDKERAAFDNALRRSGTPIHESPAPAKPPKPENLRSLFIATLAQPLTEANWTLNAIQDLADDLLSFVSLHTPVALVDGDESYDEPYESAQSINTLPRHLERIAARDYVGVNEGYWILRDAGAAIAKLVAFKSYVHQRLDEAGIPTHPEGEHSKQGCRIGDRLDIALAAPVSPPGNMAWSEDEIRAAIMAYPGENHVVERSIDAALKHIAYFAVDRLKANHGKSELSEAGHFIRECNVVREILDRFGATFPDGASAIAAVDEIVNLHFAPAPNLTALSVEG